MDFFTTHNSKNAIATLRIVTVEKSELTFVLILYFHAQINLFLGSQQADVNLASYAFKKPVFVGWVFLFFHHISLFTYASSKKNNKTKQNKTNVYNTNSFYILKPLNCAIKIIFFKYLPELLCFSSVLFVRCFYLNA